MQMASQTFEGVRNRPMPPCVKKLKVKIDKDLVIRR